MPLETDDPILAQWQFEVTVQGLPGTWATKEGGSTGGDTTKRYDGGALTPDIVGGRPVTENVTLGKGFRGNRDSALLADLRRKCLKWRTSIGVQPIDADGVPIGTGWTYTNCLLQNVGDPDVDSDSGDPSTLEIEFAVGGVA